MTKFQVTERIGDFPTSAIFNTESEAVAFAEITARDHMMAKKFGWEWPHGASHPVNANNVAFYESSKAYVWVSRVNVGGAK